MIKQPLWDDNEIQEWADQLKATGMPDSIIYATITKRVAEDFREQLGALKAENERLRSGTYQPVEDGEYVVYEEIEGDGYYCRLSIVLSKQNGENVIELIDQGDMSMEMALPSGMKVCRWQACPVGKGEGSQLPTTEVRGLVSVTLAILC